MAPSVARRRSCSPCLGTRAPPRGREVADRRPQRTYTSGRCRRRTEHPQPLAQSRRRQIRHPAASGEGGNHTRQIRRAASVAVAEDQLQSSTERRRRRGSPPPAKATPTAPSPPPRRRLDKKGTLHYVHVANRGSPVLPPPERPAEGEATADSATARWIPFLRPENRPSVTVDGEGLRSKVRLSAMFFNTKVL